MDHQKVPLERFALPDFVNGHDERAVHPPGVLWLRPEFLAPD